MVSQWLVLEREKLGKLGGVRKNVAIGVCVCVLFWHFFLIFFCGPVPIGACGGASILVLLKAWSRVCGRCTSLCRLG